MNLANQLLYVMSLFFFAALACVGSWGLYHVLKSSFRGINNPGYASRNAVMLGCMMMLVFSAIPLVCLANNDTYNFFIALGVSLGFLGCYGFLGVALGQEFSTVTAAAPNSPAAASERKSS